MADRTERILLSVDLDVDKYTTKIVNAKQKTAELKDENKRLATEAKQALDKGLTATYDEITKKIVENEAALRELNTEQRNAQKLIDLNTQANKAQSGSYEQLLRQHQIAQTNLKLLEGTLQRNADGTYQLTQEYIDQSEAVRNAKEAIIAFDQGIKDGRSNVGNYANSIQGLEAKLAELSAKFSTLDIGSDQFEQTKEEIADLKLEIDQAKGKVDEFGDREPKNPTKKAFEDATDAANGFVAAATLVTLVGGKNESSEKLQAKALQAMAVMQAIVNVRKGIQGTIDTVNLVTTKLTTTATVEATVAQEGLNTAMKANPIGAVIVAIMALIGALFALNEWLTSSSEETERLAAENERLKKTVEDQNRLIANRVKIAESEIEVMKAQGASAEEIRKKEEEINAEKRKSLENNIKVIDSNIALDKSKIQDVLTNDSLYESYLKAAAGVARFLGNEQEAEQLEAVIAINKRERAQEFLDDLKVQEDAKADAVAALNAQYAQELQQQNDFNQAQADAAQKAKDDRLKLEQQFIESQNRLIADARARELAENRTAFEKRISDIKGNSQLEINLRASLTEEMRLKEQEINKKYDDLDYQRQVKAEQERLQLMLNSLQVGQPQFLDAKLKQLDLEKQQELSNKELTEQEKLNIEEKYAQLRAKAQKENDDALHKAELARYQDLFQRRADQLQTELIDAEIHGKARTDILLAQAANERDMKLQQDNLTAERRALIEQEYEAKILAIQDQATQDYLDNIDRRAKITQNLLWAGNSLLEIFGANQGALNEFAKISALFQIGVDTAKAISGIVAGMAKFSTNPIEYGLKISSGIAIALANIAQAKKIISGEVPAVPAWQRMATGGEAKLGIFGGKPHSAGGTHLYGSDGSHIEVERGEMFAVINRRSTDLISRLSNLNSLNWWGVPFCQGSDNYRAAGGIYNAFSTGNAGLGFNEDALAAKIAVAVQKMPAPVVGVKDIIKGVERVNVTASARNA